MTAHLEKNDLVKRIPLARMGSSQEVAELVYYLSTAKYITGQVGQ